MNRMDSTTDNAPSSNTNAAEITSVEHVSDIKQHTIITITGMEPKFHKAAVEGNIDAFGGRCREQIESILTPNKNTILHIHLTNNTESVSGAFVEKVLRLCPTLVLKTNEKGETILHVAARYGHDKIVKQLMDCAKSLPKDVNEVGAEKRLVRAQNDKKDTALHEAARYGHPEVVDLLIKEESNHLYFGRNVDDETPLYIAAERQYWNVVNKILDNSESPQYNGPNRRNALHVAVLHDNEEQVSKLLEGNLSVAANEADENGWVPLHLAAIVNESSRVVEKLVSKEDQRSTAYMRDKKGRTALHLAAICGRTSVMEKILEHCPDCCELVDEKGYNALHYIMTGNKCSVSELKQVMKATPPVRNLCNEKDDDGNTPFHILARHAPEMDADCDDHPPLEEEFPLLDKMAFNKKGQTILDVAIADVPPNLAYKNKLLKKLQDIGVTLGVRVLDKQLTENKQEKRDDLAVLDKQLTENKQEKGDDSTILDKTYDQYFKGMESSLSFVAILIATVTFTAGFTLPGGLSQEGEHEGSPILKYNAAFIAFVISDSLSFVLSTSSVLFLFFSSIERSERHIYKYLLYKCAKLTLVALGFMVVAFGTGIYAVLGVSKGFGVVTLLIALSFFSIIIIVFRSLLKKLVFGPSYDHNDSLQSVRDLQLSRIP